MSTAIDARMRLFGLTKEEASEVDAASVVGRLALSGEISERQYQAAVRYELTVRSADKAYLAGSVPSGSDLNRSRSHLPEEPGSPTAKRVWGKDLVIWPGTDDEYNAKCKRDIDMSVKCYRALGACADRLARWAVDNIVLENNDLPHAYGELKIGLNALAHLFKLPLDMKRYRPPRLEDTA